LSGSKVTVRTKRVLLNKLGEVSLQSVITVQFIWYKL
jgi:hypothetical protein